MYPPIDHCPPAPRKNYKRSPHFKRSQLRGKRPRVVKELVFDLSRVNLSSAPGAPKKTFPHRYPNRCRYNSIERPEWCAKLDFEEDDPNEGNTPAAAVPS